MTINNHVKSNTVYGAVLGFENGSMPASLNRNTLVVKNAIGRTSERYAKRGKPAITTVLAVGELGELEQLADGTNAAIFHPERLNTDGTNSGPGYYATLAREQLNPKAAVLKYWMP